MRRLSLLAILTSALACAMYAPEPLGVASEPEPGAVEPLVVRPESEPEPDPLVCLAQDVELRPITPPRLQDQPDRGSCWTVPARVRRSLEREAREAWDATEDGASLEVSFACDRLGEIEEIVYETGAGHGGALELARLRRGESRDWDVLVIRREVGLRAITPDSLRVRIWRGRLSDDQIRGGIETARAAVAMELEERAPSQPGELHGYFSSADVYNHVEIVDREGRARTRAFVGYLSAGAQFESIPAGRATWAIAELLEGDVLDEAPVDGDSQAFFMARYLDAEARLFGAEFTWWVRERMVELAADHASVDLIPALSRQLCLEDDDASDARTRAGAIASILALGGQEDGLEDGLEIDDAGGVSDALAARWALACGVVCE